MTITLCNGKGGSGKTTLSILLATALAEAGHKVAVRDCDPQATASRWIAENERLQLAVPGEHYDALIIDTPPRLDSAALRESLSVADAVILVTSPSPADLWTSRDTVSFLKTHFPKPGRARVLFNQVQTKTVLSRELADTPSRLESPRRRSARRSAQSRSGDGRTREPLPCTKSASRMSTRRSDALISQLGKSLSKPAPTAAAAVLTEPPSAELAAKISISLYADDLARVDAIVAHMARHRCRVNRSEAIKIALRGVPLTPELVDLYREIQRNDGRRKNKTERAV